MRHILSVIPKDNYTLQLTFDGDEERIFDLKPYLRGSLFVPLRNEELFKKVELSKKPSGLIRPNGADLCADMLYMIHAHTQRKVERSPHVQYFQRR